MIRRTLLCDIGGTRHDMKSLGSDLVCGKNCPGIDFGTRKRGQKPWILIPHTMAVFIILGTLGSPIVVFVKT